jgi:hypothetical protein
MATATYQTYDQQQQQWKQKAKQAVKKGLSVLTKRQLNRLKFHLENKTEITPYDFYQQKDNNGYDGKPCYAFCPATLANSLNPEKQLGSQKTIQQTWMQTYNKMITASTCDDTFGFDDALPHLTPAEIRTCIRQVLRTRKLI